MKEVKEPIVVRLEQAALDDRNGEIVAHGWLGFSSIQNLRVGDYQREILETKGGRRSSLQKALVEGERLPDIMLGMRGQKYTDKAGDMLLENEVYIIDGLQRISALRKFASDNPEKIDKIRIGAEVRFNTTRDSEDALFTVLNMQRKAMSPNVILRNLRNHNDAVATLYGLSLHDSKFAMVGKICWDQQMHRGELATALSFVKMVATLHRHTAPGGRHLSGNSHIAQTIERMGKVVGLHTFRHNITALFEVIDEVWGVRGLKYTDKATHIRQNFIIQLAGVFSDHENFWDGNKLVVEPTFKAKLKSFPISDPTIIRLAGGGSNAGLLLYRLMIDHLNKGRQPSRYLTTRRIEEYHKNRKGKGGGFKLGNTASQGRFKRVKSAAG
jgi:hypothetical protein